MWYYAAILYLGNYYRKDPRERAGLAASAIAVSTDQTQSTLLGFYDNVLCHITVTIVW